MYLLTHHKLETVCDELVMF